MMINETSKCIIYFRDWHAKKVGKRCFYMDNIVWLNGDMIEVLRRTYNESLDLSTRWGEWFKKFWDLPENFRFEDDVR